MAIAERASLQSKEPEFKRMARKDTKKVAVVLVVVLVAAAVTVGLTRHGHAQNQTTTHAQALAAASPQTVNASLSEWNVGLSRTTLPAGTYTFKISNAGTMEHELIAFRTGSPSAVLPTDVKSDVEEESPAIVKATDGDDLAAGGTQTRTIDLTKPGTYVFLCNLPGHYKLGMHTTVTVTQAN